MFFATMVNALNFQIDDACKSYWHWLIQDYGLTHFFRVNKYIKNNVQIDGPNKIFNIKINDVYMNTQL